jgi:hypothetical protein
MLCAWSWDLLKAEKEKSNRSVVEESKSLENKTSCHLTQQKSGDKREKTFI